MVMMFASRKVSRKITWIQNLSAFPLPSIIAGSIPTAIKEYDDQLENTPRGKLVSFPCNIMDWNKIPPIINFCCDLIRREGLVKGIFRISGIAHLRNDVKEQSNENQGMEIDLDDVHVASNLIKEFIRSLTTPLIPAYLYDAYKRRIETVGATQCAREFVLELPKTLRSTMKEIFSVCALVVKSEEETKMGLEVQLDCLQ
jgi:hypothetical protein